MRALPLTVALALLAALLSGCAGKAPGTDNSPGGDDDSGVIDGSGDDPSTPIPGTEPTVEQRDLDSDRDLAAIAGRVHDINNFSVQDARVDLLGTEFYVKTNLEGKFTFVDLAPGKVELRVEAAGFLVTQVEVTLVADKEATVDIPLKLKGNPFAVPHIHDFWTGPTRVLMDADVEVPQVEQPGGYAAADSPDSRAAGGAVAPSATFVQQRYQNLPWQFWLPESLDNKVQTIWPGTVELQVTLSWSTAPDENVPKAGIQVQDSAFLVDPRKGNKDMGSVTNGGTLSWPVLSNQTDHGHAQETEWSFFLYIDNKATPPSPVLALGSIHVKIVQVRGEVGPEPGHRDDWKGNDTLVVGDPAATYTPGGPVGPLDSTSTSSPQAVLTIRPMQGQVAVIPPGTERLTLRFSWTHSNGDPPWNYYLTYRTADQNDRTPSSQYKDPKVIEGGGANDNFVVYEIAVKSEETDAFYQDISRWGFKWNEDHAASSAYYFGAYLVRFKMEITAFKDPDF